MGLDSDDMDITIDKKMGCDFADLFNKYLKEKGYPVSHIGVVSANPDQSKHLQTAIVDVLGMKIDFVNMRSEQYTNHSRIPTGINFGTPDEDSHRRDATINSMYFNVHTGLVEDWTRLGIRDLHDKLIRTPLSAYDIFTDDPLRILRCIRFAARFNFTLDDEIEQAIRYPGILDALANKVSRERIGIELYKMLTCRADIDAPIRAIRYLHSLSLMPIIYRLPSCSMRLDKLSGGSYTESFLMTEIFGYFYAKMKDIFPPVLTPRNFSLEGLHLEDSILNQLSLLPVLWPLEKQTLYIVWNSLCLLPFRNKKCKKSINSREVIVSLVEYIASFSLKGTNNNVDQLKSSVENAQLLVDFLLSYSPNDFTKLVSCMRLLGPRWEHTWIVAMPLYYYQRHHMHSKTPAVDSELIDSVVERFVEFRAAVYRHNLDMLWLAKPVLKGDAVIKLLNIKKPTVYLHRLLCELVVWQMKQYPLNMSSSPIVDEVCKRRSLEKFQQSISLKEAEKFLVALDADPVLRNELQSDIYPRRCF